MIDKGSQCTNNVALGGGVGRNWSNSMKLNREKNIKTFSTILSKIVATILYYLSNENVEKN
jgi:hypothetical protein